MKIIDFERKGNVVRFWLGEDELDTWHGDDWNDVPYEHNAERVYDRFISGYRDMVFPFDSLVLEPCCGTGNSDWCKDDMRTRKLPCIIVVPHEMEEDSWYGENFAHWVAADGVQRYYFGDSMEPEKVVKWDG